MEYIESFSNIEYITLEIVGNIDNFLLLESQIIYKLIRFEKIYIYIIVSYFFGFFLEARSSL